MDDLIKVYIQIHNFTKHEQTKSNNPRITVPFRVQMAQEISADGLGNTLSKNIIQNFENESGN
jgi:hypothetical protein